MSNKSCPFSNSDFPNHNGQDLLDMQYNICLMNKLKKYYYEYDNFYWSIFKKSQKYYGTYH